MKKTELFTHQLKAISSAAKYPARLIFRLPGTGKTRIGMELILAELQKFNLAKILWLSPANLIDQLKNNFALFDIEYYDIFPERKIRPGKCAICSYDMFRLNKKYISSFKWDLVICDEIHKAKSIKTQINSALWDLRKKSLNWYGLTGTPFQNNQYEFFELVSLCAGKKLDLQCELCLQYKHPRHTPVRNFFRMLGFSINRVNKGPVIGISNTAKLIDILTPIVDYIAPEKYLSECKLPTINISSYPVEMTLQEEKIYKQISKNYNRTNKFKAFVSDNLPDEKIEGCFQKLSALRTVSLKDSKANAVIEIIKNIQGENKKAKILVFSNFVEDGLIPLSKKMFENEINHILYYGQLSQTKRISLIGNYINSTNCIMLLSPVGFEGLDLYGTTHIIIMDPHYNPERTRQLMSRAIRAYSDIDELQIIKLESTSKKLQSPLIDEIINKIALRKEKVAKLIEAVLQ